MLRFVGKLLGGCLVFVVVFGVVMWLLGIGLRVFRAADPFDFLGLGADTRAAVEALDSNFPFDEPTSHEAFDASRFITSLEVRTVYVERVSTERALDGWFESMRRRLREDNHVLVLAPELASVRMGWREFRWYQKALWAALHLVDAETVAAHPELAAYIDTSTRDDILFVDRIRPAMAALPDGVGAAALAVLADHPELLARAVASDGSKAVPAFHLDFLPETAPKR